MCFDTDLMEGKTGIALVRHLPEMRKDWIGKNIYTEALSGAQFHFSTLESPMSDYRAFKLIFQILETSFTRILIADERVSEFYKRCSSEKRELINEMGVTIPFVLNFNIEKDEMKIMLTDEEIKVNNERNSSVTFDNEITLKTGESKYDVLIIHQGILDKLWKNKDNIKQNLCKVKQTIPFIAITSGRGTPSELPDYEKFIPFSELREFFIKDYPEKILLLNSIFKVISKPLHHG